MWPANPSKKVKLEFGSLAIIPSDESAPFDEILRDEPERRKHRSRCVLLDLNDDCLYAICKYVPIMDLCSIVRTSVRLNEVGHRIFRSKHKILNVEDTMPATVEPRIVFQVFGSQILELNIRLCFHPADLMDDVVRYCTTLKSLTLRSYTIPDNQEKIAGLAKLFRKLHTLRMIDVTPKGNSMNLFIDCDSLIDLTLCACYGNDHFILASTFPNLQHFEYHSDAYSNEINDFVLRHTNLQSISLYSEFSLYSLYTLFDGQFDTLAVIAANCKNLAKIEFGLGYRESQVEREAVLKDLSKLSKLKAMNILCGGEYIVKELPNFRNLEVLQLSYVHADSEMIQTIVQLQKLRFFRLNQLYDANSSGALKDLDPLGKMTNLTELSIEEFHENNLQFNLVKMVHRLVHLRKLKFWVNDFEIGNSMYRQLVDVVKWRNPALLIDCQTTDDFVDLKLATLKFVRIYHCNALSS